MEISKDEFEQAILVATSSHSEVYDSVKPHFIGAYDKIKSFFIGSEGIKHLDETEEITVHLFTLQELIDLLRRDEMKQSLMVAPLWRYIAENHLL